MLPAETKQEFIKLRAEGLSYEKIQKELGISKSTCSKWEQQLADQIAEYKAEQLKELYNEYGMLKEARIKRLGDTVNKLKTAIDNLDLSEVAPEKLLDLYLKYTDALKSEYIAPITKPTITGENVPQELVKALTDLLTRIQAGEVTAEQASRESTAIANIIKAYEQVEVKQKIEALEAIIEAR